MALLKHSWWRTTRFCASCQLCVVDLWSYLCGSGCSEGSDGSNMGTIRYGSNCIRRGLALVVFIHLLDRSTTRRKLWAIITYGPRCIIPDCDTTNLWSPISYNIIQRMKAVATRIVKLGHLLYGPGGATSTVTNLIVGFLWKEKCTFSHWRFYQWSL